jgi:transcriptional regulator with XRE-family HTH domain
LTGRQQEIHSSFADWARDVGARALWLACASMSVSNIDVIVGRRLRLLRLLADMSVDDLAALTGMSAGEVTACELGHMRFGPTHIAAVAEHSKLPVSWFFFTFVDQQFESCVLQLVEEATQTRRPEDNRFLSRISQIVDVISYADPDDRDRLIEEARVLVRDRSSA